MDGWILIFRVNLSMNGKLFSNVKKILKVDLF